MWLSFPGWGKGMGTYWKSALWVRISKCKSRLLPWVEQRAWVMPEEPWSEAMILVLEPLPSWKVYPTRWHSPLSTKALHWGEISDLWLRRSLWQAADCRHDSGHCKPITTICSGHLDLVSWRGLLNYWHHWDLLGRDFPAVQWLPLYGNDLREMTPISFPGWEQGSFLCHNWGCIAWIPCPHALSISPDSSPSRVTKPAPTCPIFPTTVTTLSGRIKIGT